MDETPVSPTHTYIVPKITALIRTNRRTWLNRLV